MPKFRIKTRHKGAHTYYTRGHSANRFYPDPQFDNAVMYSGDGYPYPEEGYEEPTSEDEPAMVYSPFRSTKPRFAEYDSPGIKLNERSSSQYSPFTRSQKLVKPLRFSKRKVSRKRNLVPVYSHSQRPYESSFNNEMGYQESRIDEPDSSEYEANSRFDGMRPPLPLKNFKHEVVSNISIPILNKTNAKAFQLEIEDILSSDLPNNKALLNKIMLKLNKSLLLSIDSYVSIVKRDELLNNSYDSQISQSLEQGRIHNCNDTLERWKESCPQFTLGSANLNQYASLVETYCENPYIRYIILSNIALAFSMIGEDKKSLEIFKILNPLSLKKSARGTNTHSMAYQSLLQAAKYFNLGVYNLRKIKTEAMMNQRYEQLVSNETDFYEPYQRYFHKAIELLNDQILYKKSRYSEAKKRYYSGDFRVTHHSRSSFSGRKDSNLAEAMEIIAGYSYYCLGILSKTSDPYSAETFFDRSYKFLKSFNDPEISEIIQRELYETEYAKEGMVEELETFHLIFNTMFGVSDRFSVFIVKLYDIEMPHFTYYNAIPKLHPLANASRSTSQNVRLEDDSISSPILQSNSFKKKHQFDAQMQPEDKDPHSKFGQKKFRVMKKKKYMAHTQSRITTSKPKKYQEFPLEENPKASKKSNYSRGNYDLEHGEEYNNQQQAHLHTSGISDAEVSDTIDYVPQTILENQYRKNKKKVIKMKKKRKPAPYTPAQYLSESTEERYQHERKQNKMDTEQSSSLKELFRRTPENFSKENSFNQHFEAPEEAKVVFESDGDQNNRSDSLLVPLADQESGLSNKESDYEKVEYDEEQNEKAIFIQKVYRKKQKARQEQEAQAKEENEKASLIQKHYRAKVQKQKEKEEEAKYKEEENASATLIQRRYRKKLQERRAKEENEKATVIQRMYRDKKKKQREQEENEKATVIQRMYREKKQKQKEKKQQNQDIDEVLGIPVDQDLQNTASFIQLQYRKKKQKQANSKAKDTEDQEEDPTLIVSSDPAERKIQEEKATLIQNIFRQKKGTKK